MILITMQAKVKPEHKDEAIEAALQMQVATEGEAGCIQYRFWHDLEDPNLIMLLEEWETQDALDAHYRTTHREHFVQLLPKLLATETLVSRYNID